MDKIENTCEDCGDQDCGHYGHIGMPACSKYSKEIPEVIINPNIKCNWCEKSVNQLSKCSKHVCLKCCRQCYGYNGGCMQGHGSCANF